MAGQSLPEFESQVKLNAVTTPAPWAQSFDSMALSPTALGTFGANLALTASTTLAQQRGYQAGKDPHGSMLPPLTQTDKAYVDAYNTQAQNTLGLQANRLMQQGQMELAKAWKLTPDMVASYTKNMSEGLNDIINNAPMQVQPGLANSFNANLMNSTSSLNRKMIGQQKEKALQDASLYNSTQLSSIYETARNGNFEAAQKMAEDMVGRTKNMSAAGMYSPLQAEAARKSAQNSLYTGLYTGEALNAFNHKNSDQYLSELLQKKPDGVNQLEWEGIARNVMGEVQLAESFQQRNETSLYSEANRLLMEGTLSSDFIAQLESATTSKPRFNNFMAQVAAYQRKNHKDNMAVNSLMPAWNSPYEMAKASNKTKNLALMQAGQDVQQRAADGGRTLDDFEAQAEAMSTAGGPIQNFTQQMNAGFLSGNPQLMQRNLNAYRALKNANPSVLNNMDKRAQAMMTSFESQLEDGNAPDIAAQKATETVLQKTPEQMEINTALIEQWERKAVNTPSRLNSWASDLIDNGEGAHVNNLPYFAIHAKNIFKDNMNYLNGDVEGATRMTKEGINRAWGVTTVNGKKEFVFQPVEQTIGLDEGANPLIKHDLYSQLQAQIAPMKQAYEDGKKNGDHRMSFYYEMEARPSYEEYKTAQDVVNKKIHEPRKSSGFAGTPLAPMAQKIPEDKAFDDAIQTIKRFKDENIKIKRVFDSGRSEDFQVAIAASPGLQQDAQGIIGSYNVSMRKDNGPSSPMNGWFSGPLSEPVYRPNQSQIRSRYFEMVGLNSTGLTTQQIYERYVNRKKAREEAHVNSDINHLGRSFR